MQSTPVTTRCSGPSQLSWRRAVNIKNIISINIINVIDIIIIIHVISIINIIIIIHVISIINIIIIVSLPGLYYRAWFVCY